MEKAFASPGIASTMGLITTSISPLPKAQRDTAIKIPEKALSNIVGRTPRAVRPNAENR